MYCFKIVHNADVDLALVEVVHVDLDHVDGGLSDHGIGIDLNSTNLIHVYQPQIMLCAVSLNLNFGQFRGHIENWGVLGGKNPKVTNDQKTT